MWLMPDLLQTRRALLADDNEELRSAIGQIIASCGFAVSEAGNGRKALQLFDEANGGFDLLLTDISMPEMDGRELIREVRNRDLGIPIIVVTSSDDLQTIREIESHNAEMFHKPVDIPALHACIKRLMIRG